MRSLLVFPALILLPLISHCQITFQRSYDLGTAESAYTVTQTFDGGYAICGRKSAFGSPVAFLLRTNPYGDSLWSKTYPDYMTYAERIMHQTADSGFILCGNDSSIWLIKTDRNGDTLWTSHLPGRVASGVAETADHGYIITSPYPSPNLTKTDAAGKLVWQQFYRIYAPQDYGNVYSFLQTSDGGYMMAGNCQYNAFGMTTLSSFLVKANAGGDSLWTKIYSYVNGKVDLYTVSQTADGGYFLSGSMVPFLGYSRQGYAVRTNENGDTLWTGRNHFQESEFISSDIASDGNFITSGVMQTNTGGYGVAIMLFKYRQNGTVAFTRYFPYGDIGNSVQTTSDHGFIIAGEKSGNIILIKTDSLGRAAPAGIDENNNQEGLTIFPNPSHGKFRLTIPANATSVEVTDIRGQVVYRKSFTGNPPGEVDIDLSSWGKGGYVVTVVVGSTILYGKLVNW
ncbi:MAG: T9SS type A sorting domain-containing protein [Bacteroidales bacterium]